VINHDAAKAADGGSEQKGESNLFSRASFTVTGAEGDNEVNIDDPKFWEKWAKTANLDVDDLLNDSTDDLIVHQPRQRKVVQRYDPKLEEGGSDGDDDAVLGTKDKKAKGTNYSWSFQERLRLESKLSAFGFGRWKEILDSGKFGKRDERDIAAACFELLNYVIHFGLTADEDAVLKELAQELINTAEPKVPWSGGGLNADGTKAVDSSAATPPVTRKAGPGRKPKNAAPQPPQRISPFSGASERSISYYHSYIKDASESYKEHLKKKGKNNLYKKKNVTMSYYFYYFIYFRALAPRSPAADPLSPLHDCRAFPREERGCQ